MNIITLSTDFGARDWFVGTMKGVILSINPQAIIVDITHEIAPGDVRAGAFVLRAACRFFPAQTIHVAVVDPGVGSRRPAIAVQTDRYTFIGPDNGVLSWALAQEKVRTIRRLENQKCFLHPVSRTFHGRDVFAPVAAHLSKGFPFQKLGRAVRDFARLPWPEPRRMGKALCGQIVYVDRFGNAITNIPEELARPGLRRRWKVMLGRKQLCRVEPFYQAVPPGKPVAVFGSSGLLEIAINGGNAAKQLALAVADPVSLQAG